MEGPRVIDHCWDKFITNSERLGEVRNQLYPSLELSTINRGLLQLIENQINSAVTTGDDQQIAATREQLAEIIENLDRIAQLNPSQQSDVKALKSELNGYYSTATRQGLSKPTGHRGVIQLNVNLSHEFYSDVKVALLHICDGRHPGVYLPFLVFVCNVVLNGPPYLLLRLMSSAYF